MVVCTPVSRIPHDVRRAAEAAPAAALVTDAGSTKRQIVETVEAAPCRGRRLRRAHPLAGSERSGAAHARAELFRRPRLRADPHARGRRADRLRRARDVLERAGMPGARDEPDRARRGPGLHEPSARTPWPRPSRRPSPPNGWPWPPGPTATARASPAPTPASGPPSSATIAARSSRPWARWRNGSPPSSTP